MFNVNDFPCFNFGRCRAKHLFFSSFSGYITWSSRSLDLYKLIFLLHHVGHSRYGSAQIMQYQTHMYCLLRLSTHFDVDALIFGIENIPSFPNLKGLRETTQYAFDALGLGRIHHGRCAVLWRLPRDLSDLPRALLLGDVILCSR